MERRGAVLTVVSLVLVSACSKASAPVPQASPSEPLAASVAIAHGGASSALGAPGTASDPERPLRRIIRGADLGIETRDVADAERRASAIVEEMGGYVASSDRSLRSTDEEPAEPAVNMVLRVPSDRFTAALTRLEKLGSRVLAQRVNSDDVTEEFIDLKARTVAQRALEVQFLEILKQARSVKDALEVNVQLAEVRTTIEKLEGRQRLLENQTSISTVKLAITHGVPLLRASRFAFANSIERAGADLLNVSAAILHGSIRLLGVLLPMIALIVLPTSLVLRAFLRRRRRLPARA